MNNLYISTYPFGEVDPKPLKLLQENKIQFDRNTFFRKLKPDELVSKAQNAELLIVGTEDLLPLIESNSKLKFISRVGIGLDTVPLQICKEKGIRVAYTPDAVTMAVVEITVGIMISLTRFVGVSDRALRRGEWKRRMGKRIAESRIGIVGFGRVGSNLAKVLRSLNPKEILVFDTDEEARDKANIFREKYDLNIRNCSYEELLENSDITTFHVPLSAQTKNMLDENMMKLVPQTSFLINQARGGIINEMALFNALQNNSIAGAAIDVFETEPYKGSLINLDNILLTHHMGSCSFDCRRNMESEAAQAVIDFINGTLLKNEVPAREYLYQLM